MSRFRPIHPEWDLTGLWVAVSKASTLPAAILLALDRSESEARLVAAQEAWLDSPALNEVGAPIGGAELRRSLYSAPSVLRKILEPAWSPDQISFEELSRPTLVRMLLRLQSASAFRSQVNSLTTEIAFGPPDRISRRVKEYRTTHPGATMPQLLEVARRAPSRAEIESALREIGLHTESAGTAYRGLISLLEEYEVDSLESAYQQYQSAMETALLQELPPATAMRKLGLTNAAGTPTDPAYAELVTFLTQYLQLSSTQLQWLAALFRNPNRYTYQPWPVAVQESVSQNGVEAVETLLTKSISPRTGLAYSAAEIGALFPIPTGSITRRTLHQESPNLPLLALTRMLKLNVEILVESRGVCRRERAEICPGATSTLYLQFTSSGVDVIAKVEAGGLRTLFNSLLEAPTIPRQTSTEELAAIQSSFAVNSSTAQIIRAAKKSPAKPPPLGQSSPRPLPPILETPRENSIRMPRIDSLPTTPPTSNSRSLGVGPISVPYMNADLFSSGPNLLGLPPPIGGSLIDRNDLR